MSRARNLTIGLALGATAIGIVSQVPGTLAARERPDRQSPGLAGQGRAQEVQHNLPTKKMPGQDPTAPRESSKRSALWAAGDSEVPAKKGQ
ncbi:hypothetical protein Tdes44962_MAKER03293 [Teratosphaeria destructans]|uniref:Uncharacterized protein n=1 Tax=Teratosphaeria destructans TaxID=418781 RepID=A0A9W7W1U9_9PEZI|nr:hypothetical protein Tdes44962_MAKER03293 [Teratosphaeria destructans]